MAKTAPLAKKIPAAIGEILPKHMWNQKTLWLDAKLYAVNMIVLTALAVLFGISGDWLRHELYAGMSSIFGHANGFQIGVWPFRIVVTVGSFVAFEFGFWLSHYLLHRVGFFWRAHELHHSATAMTPLTGSRQHPIEVILITVCLAVSAAFTQAVLERFFGQGNLEYQFLGTNIVLFIYVQTIDNLRHSHLWFPFKGPISVMLLSPAHHQMHHSTDISHQQHNFGLATTLFDRLFGTLEMPGPVPVQNFGTPDNPYIDAGIVDAYLKPFRSTTKR
ncbi:MAG: sterol desaturase family protein [Aestuariivirga sp.]